MAVGTIERSERNQFKWFRKIHSNVLWSMTFIEKIVEIHADTREAIINSI